MSIQADLLNPELGYADEGVALDSPALYQSVCRPFGEATVLPPVAFRSKTFLELESEKIWTRSWAVVGLDRQIPNPGDLLPFTLGFHGLHVQRNRDGTLAARMNRHQHGGCRFVPVQCRTGVQTKCSITSCNYTRDADAMSATQEGENTDEMFKFVGIVPEKLKPVIFDCWGPFIFVNLDPECEALAAQIGQFASRLPAWFSGPLAIRTKLWLDVKANWKEIGEMFLRGACFDSAEAPADGSAAFAGGSLRHDALNEICGRISVHWAFPNLLIAAGADHAFVVVLQSTAPGKTLCRLFVVAPASLPEDRAARLSFAWIARFKKQGAQAEALHQDHLLHGTAARPGTSASDLPHEVNYGGYLMNRFVAARACTAHRYYWTAPIMDAAMLMRGVR